jgi:alkylation response protein AidB-like acyl-CoA dehydrogenase
MNFDYTDKVKDMRARLLAFMDEHIYPNESRFFAEIAANRAKGNAWIPTTLIEELKPKARAAGLWNLFLPQPACTRRPVQPGIRAHVRNHGPGTVRRRGVQLLGARHRQHGNPGALRQRGHLKDNGWSRCSRAKSARPS